MADAAVLGKVLLYIEENLTEDITLEKLAVLSGYSKFHFHRLFQLAAGETVMEYIRRRRIMRAARDLCDRSSVIASTAMEYGFDSHDAFTRAFKRYMGVTPSDYRKINARMLDPSKNDLKEAIQMADHIPYERMACSSEEKRQFIELAAYILELSQKAHKKGLLALEPAAEGRGFFFRKTLELILDGVEPGYLRNVMMNYILTGNDKGRELFQKILTLEGLLAIQAGEHPLLLSEKLLSLLGEDVAQEAEHRLIPSSRLQHDRINAYMSKLADTKPLSVSTALLEDPVEKLDSRSLQRLLRELPVDDITDACRGAGGDTVGKILQYLPAKVKRAVITALDTPNMVPPGAIIEAQKRMLETLLKLRADGDIQT